MIDLSSTSVDVVLILRQEVAELAICLCEHDTSHWNAVASGAMSHSRELCYTVFRGINLRHFVALPEVKRQTSIFNTATASRLY